MAVFLEGACILIHLTVIAHLSQAMVCQMGQEPDSNTARRYRWIIPVEDPCTCTEIRPGGINNRTPGRHFNGIYFDTLLVSNSPMEIRKWFNCSDASQDNKIKPELNGGIPASQRVVVTTHATSNAPATSDIPVTSFTCLGRVNGGHFADPYDCGMFYQCDNGVAHHKSCGPDQHFSKIDQVCAYQRDANCFV